MSLDPIVNFGKVTTSTGYDSIAMDVMLNSGDGDKLPDPALSGAYNLVWFNNTDYTDPSDDPFVEIVRVTSRTNDMLTISRGQENTSPSNKNISGRIYRMLLTPTKRLIDDIQKFGISTDQTDFASQSFTNVLSNGNFESWSLGETSAPDGWYAGAGTTLYRDGTNKKIGIYSASLTSPNGAQGYIYQQITDLTYYRGRTVTLGGWVKTSVPARVTIYIQDGISSAISPYHTGSGNWEFLTVPFVINNAATELTIFCIIYIPGTPITAYFDGMILVQGSIVSAFSPKPLVDDAKTLIIDSINNKVGINTIFPPNQALDIVGNIAVSGTVDDVDISTIPLLYVDKTGAQTLTNKTITDSTNNVMAKSLKSATTTVDISAATAPTAGQTLRATASTAATWQSETFTKGATMYNSNGIANAALNIITWTAPFACTVTAIKGYRVGGTGATVNARKNGSLTHRSSNLSLTSADTWMDGGAVQNTAYAIGDKLEVMIASTSGTVTQIAIQVNFTRP